MKIRFMDPVFPTPSAGFDHPLEMMDDCHDRILRNCQLIERVAERVFSRGVDAEARAAALNVMRYFDTAGANHHVDEEEDLFPALQHHTPSEELNAAFALIFRLRTEHKKLEVLWADMRSRLSSVVQGRAGGLTPEVALTFRKAYETHIAAEEGELLPLARRVLPADILELLGERMARRRGVELHP